MMTWPPPRGTGTAQSDHSQFPLKEVTLNQETSFFHITITMNRPKRWCDGSGEIALYFMEKSQSPHELYPTPKQADQGSKGNLSERLFSSPALLVELSCRCILKWRRTQSCSFSFQSINAIWLGVGFLCDMELIPSNGSDELTILT